MMIKSVVSAAALSAAMLFSGAVFAQDAAPTMIGEQAISEADLGAVKERCLQLTNAASTESLTESDSGSNDNAGDANATIEDAPAVNEAEAVTSPIDFDSITLEQCEAAGLGM